MSLSDAAVRATKPRQKPFKRADDRGLYLLVQPNGSKLWRTNYTFAGRQRTMAFGAYPDVSLSEAREARDAAKKKLRAGIDPSAVVKAEKVAEKQAIEHTFSAVSAEWLKRKMVAEGKAERTLERTEWLLGILNDGIGKTLLSEIEAPELLAVLRKVEAAGKNETVKRLRATASTVFRFGIATGVCKRDPAADLKGALTSATSTPRAAITDPVGVGELLRSIDGYKRPMLRLALQFLALTFVRPGEVCSAEWSEINTDAVWSIPGAKMKMKKPHRVPLSKQALAVLAELRKISGDSKFLFPSRKRGRHIFANRLNVALREIGYDAEQVSAHGFRSTASTILNEHSEFSPDAIELSLAHVSGDVRSVYNRAQRWIERRELAQWYANYLDGLRQRGEVVKMPKKKSMRTVA
jgi:integrase